ncbi:hypothetical protein [Parasphingorhabdus sp.]|uniref:hypothetical protein n=1 Tax=Parasphingorhabdus sp. TaxID=2709688 RepID=UPI003D270042
MPNMLPVNHLRLVLDTRKPLQVETSAEILSSLAQSLRNDPDIGDRAGIEIVEVKQGSWWAEIAIITGTLVGAVGVIANSASNLASEITEGRTPFARSIAAAASEGEAEMCELITAEQSLEIPKQEMKALAGMVPGENFYGKGPFGQPSTEDLPTDLGSDLPVNEDETNSDSSAPDKATTYVGELIESVDGLTFRLNDGRTALVVAVGTGLTIPNDQIIEIEAFLDRGSRGGLADPRLTIVDWKPADDPFARPNMSEEEKLMMQVMYDTPDDTSLHASTKTYIGQFVERSNETFFVTRDSVEFGVLHGTKRPLEKDFVIRAQRFEHPKARFDWLRVMDVFEIEEN